MTDNDKQQDSLKKNKIDESAIKNLTEKTFSITEGILEKCPVRLAGSDLCIKSADLLVELLGENVDKSKVKKEKFIFHPEALLSFFRVIAFNYTLSFILLMIDTALIPIAFILFAFSLIFGVSQFVFYKPYFDKFHKKAEGYNVYAEIEPKNEVKQQIIITGHHDSSHIFSFIENKKLQKYYAFRITFGLVPAFFYFGYFLYWMISYYGFGVEPILKTPMLILMGIMLFFVIPLFWFIRKGVSPGAGDNLIASSMAVALSSYIGKELKLENTRIILGSLDAEESGLRGARAFRLKHAEEHSKTPTFALIVDGIYDVEELQLLTYDINGFKKLSKDMALQVHNIAKKIGYELPQIRIPFGGGSTDAGELARGEIETTTIIGISSDIVREGLDYHTSRDTLDKVSKEAVEAIIKIALNYIVEKDNQIQI